jgi:hypothetical protein
MICIITSKIQVIAVKSIPIVQIKAWVLDSSYQDRGIALRLIDGV